MRGQSANAGGGIPDIANPRLNTRQQRQQLEFIQKLNQEKLRREKEHPGVEGVIESYELAFRMQAEMPDLTGFIKRRSENA